MIRACRSGISSRRRERVYAMLVYPLPLRRSEKPIDDRAMRLRAVLTGLDGLLNELDTLGLELAAAYLSTAMDHLRAIGPVVTLDRPGPGRSRLPG